MVTNDLNGDGQYKVQIEIGNEAGIPPAIPAEGIIDVTDVIKNGKMGGMLDLRDNLLPEYMHNLDQLAAGVVMQVNLLHATGYGLDGSTGLSFFVGSNDYNNNTQTGNNPVTGLPWGIDSTNNFANMVKNLNVNVAIGGNPQMNIVGDPRSVAAADVANASGNNEIARQLAELQTKDGTVIVPDGLGGNIFKGPFSEFITGVANTVGNQALKFKSGANTDENIRVALETQRDSLSAVDMDEEATNLIVFQRSYQACSRFISVINQLTDQLINNFGR
jgi:flagellar hook-associated protein 1 FlgK